MAANLGFTPMPFAANLGGTVVPIPLAASPNFSGAGVTCTNATYAAAGVVTPAGTAAPGCTPIPPAGAPSGSISFGPNDFVTRAEMAYWIIKAQMDEPAITSYLTLSGGTTQTFADVPVTNPYYRYIEVMARRGYTSGCSANVARRYCPDYIATRKDMAVFMIRAKMGNVFPSVVSGCSFTYTTFGATGTTSFFPFPATNNCAGGDTPTNFVPALGYFTDNLTPVAGTINDEYLFLQLLRTLRVTNGTSLGPNSDGRNGTYGRGNPNFPLPTDPNGLLRKQVATFIMRGFFF
jgi:hypothetical protein